MAAENVIKLAGVKDSLLQLGKGLEKIIGSLTAASAAYPTVLVASAAIEAKNLFAQKNLTAIRRLATMQSEWVTKRDIFGALAQTSMELWDETSLLLPDARLEAELNPSAFVDMIENMSFTVLAHTPVDARENLVS